MLKYHELIEKKLSQLNQQHVSKTKDLEKAMHSQGIDPGEPKRDAHHVQYPKATFRRTGKPARGITAVDDGKGKLTSSTGGNTVRDAVLKSGRVDKRPAAKAKRKTEAEENRAAKKKNRDPFTREHTEWWVDMFREATESDLKAMGANDKQLGELKKRQEKRGYGFNKDKSQGQHFDNKPKSSPTVTNKATGGALAKREPTSIQKTSSSALAKRPEEKSGALATKTPGRGESGPGARPDRKPQPYRDSPKTKTNKFSSSMRRMQKSASEVAKRALNTKSDDVDKVSPEAPVSTAKQTRGYQSSAG